MCFEDPHIEEIAHENHHSGGFSCVWGEQRALGAQRWSRFLGKSGNFVVEGTSLKDVFAFLRWERAGWGMAVVW